MLPPSFTQLAIAAIQSRKDLPLSRDVRQERQVPIPVVATNLMQPKVSADAVAREYSWTWWGCRLTNALPAQTFVEVAPPRGKG